MGILDRVGTGAYEVPNRIDPRRTDLREQFLADPLGRHELDLQLVVGAMRSSRAIPRWILVVTQPGQAWMVAEAGRRGTTTPTWCCTCGAGAAFSVSSMAWCAALSHNGYANDVARITHNVLRRFLDPAPFTSKASTGHP